MAVTPPVDALAARLGLGTAPLGNLFAVVTDDESDATVREAWDRGVRVFDTAPQYGHGLVETRLGRVLRGLPREALTVSSKVGRLLRTVSPRPATIFRDVPPVDPVFDFSHDGVLRSIDESLVRLGLDRLDIVHVHDPDDHEQQAIDGAFPVLCELRDQGVIGRVGCGMNQAPMLSRFVDRVDLDCVLLAGRYSLLDRSGADLLDRCAARGVDVIIGGVFNSGLLARPEVGATFDYAAAPGALVERARSMQRVCQEFGVALPAAALHFVMRHPAVSTVLFGARSPEEVDADVRFACEPLPEGLWRALEAIS